MAVAGLNADATGTTAAAALLCTLQAPTTLAAEAPALLRLTLHNGGHQTLEVLVWGTPFEPAWFAPWVRVFRADGSALPYRGAKIKRGEPAADDYLRIAPGQSREAAFDLAPAFDTAVPGHYRVQPQVWLHDVVVAQAEGAAPQLRQRQAGSMLVCNAVEFERR